MMSMMATISLAIAGGFAILKGIGVFMSSIPEWKSGLIKGYHNFRAGAYRREKGLYEELGKHGQSPKVMLIACADSRADPGDIFDSHPGELFVVRNVANLVPPRDGTEGYHGTSAALEFAVQALKVEAIVVMGHESCGGIDACLRGEGDRAQGYVGKWISMLNGARDAVVKRAEPCDYQRELEFEGIRQSLRHLESFPCVKKRVEDGSLALMGAYFSIIKGVLMFADGADGEFREVPTK